jgi:hypothetical protein
MAAGLGYIELATGDVLTASIANGYLASQTVMVFASAAARTSAITSPQEGMVSYLKDTNAIEYYSGSAWVAVGGGGGGKVLQVVQATSTTTASTNGSTYTDTTLTASITPSATTSKILVMTYQSFLLIRGTVSDAGAYVNLVRGSTDILTQPGLTIEYGNDNDHKWPVSINYLDSPSTTSSTTYKTQMKTGSTSHTIYAQQANTPSVMILMEIGA